MGWTTPLTYTTSQLVTAANLNAGTANDAFLYGDTAWTAAVLTSSWVNTGAGYSVAAYRLVGNTVFLRGRINGGVAGTQIFILPSGYRPVNGSLIFGGAGSAAFVSLQLTTGGVLSHLVGATTDVNLSCVIFDVLN
jgi:hypothetical protein